MNARLRQRVLNEWAGGRAEPPIPEPVEAGAALRAALKRLGITGHFEQASLAQEWREVVGPSLVAHCHPSGVRRGVLTVLVDHPAWLHQITLAHKADILRSVQARFPHLNIRGLNLRIG